MTEREHLIRRIVRDVIVSVAVAGIVAFLAWLSGLLPIIWEWIKDAWTWLIRPLSVPRVVGIPIGLVALVSLGWAVLRVYRWWRPVDAGDVGDAEGDAEPNSSQYTKDTFYEIVWTWQWASWVEYGVHNLQPYCPECDNHLVTRRPEFPRMADTVTRFYCDNCQSETAVPIGFHEIRGTICRQIDRKRRTGDWKQVVKGYGD